MHWLRISCLWLSWSTGSEDSKKRIAVRLLLKRLVLLYILVGPKDAFFDRWCFGLIFDDARANGKIHYFLPTVLIHVAPRRHGWGDHGVSQVENIIIQLCRIGEAVSAQGRFERHRINMV